MPFANEMSERVSEISFEMRARGYNVFLSEFPAHGSSASGRVYLSIPGFTFKQIYIEVGPLYCCVVKEITKGQKQSWPRTNDFTQLSIDIRNAAT